MDQAYYEQVARQEEWLDETITVCPYCGNEAEGKFMCCGESSAHFVQMSRKAYEEGEDIQ